MSKTKSPSYPLESLLKGLRGLLDSLPTADEKRELLQTLQEAQTFLEDMRLLVEAVPTMESSEELAVGMSRLNSLSDRARQDTRLSRLLGIRGQQDGAKGTPAARNGNIREHVNHLADAVSESETQEVPALLERESVATLKELASHFGMRTPSKERKMDLVGRIVNHVENQRGYALLRGTRETQPFPSGEKRVDP